MSFERNDPSPGRLAQRLLRPILMVFTALGVGVGMLSFLSACGTLGQMRRITPLPKKGDTTSPPTTPQQNIPQNQEKVGN